MILLISSTQKNLNYNKYVQNTKLYTIQLQQHNAWLSFVYHIHVYSIFYFQQ